MKTNTESTYTVIFFNPPTKSFNQ